MYSGYFIPDIVSLITVAAIATTTATESSSFPLLLAPLPASNYYSAHTILRPRSLVRESEPDFCIRFADSSGVLLLHLIGLSPR